MKYKELKIEQARKICIKNKTKCEKCEIRQERKENNKIIIQCCPFAWLKILKNLNYKSKEIEELLDQEIKNYDKTTKNNIHNEN